MYSLYVYKHIPKLQLVKRQIQYCMQTQQIIMFHADHLGLQSSGGLQLEGVKGRVFIFWML